MDHWPLQSFLDLGALPGAVPCARLHTRHVPWERGVATLADSIVLSPRWSRTRMQISGAMTQTAIRLWLVSDRTRVTIVAWDASPLPPVRADPRRGCRERPGPAAGRGHQRAVGWYFPAKHGSANARDQRGKVVWAVLRLSTRTAVEQRRQ